MPNDNDATETSPLLRSTSNPSSKRADAPNGSLPHQGGIDGHTSKGGNDEESQDYVTEYQGMPEVRARLKYILPAMAIGVFLSAADQTLIVTTYGKIGSELSALNKSSWVSTAYVPPLSLLTPACHLAG